MKKLTTSGLISLIILVLLLAACAPKTAPISTPAPTAAKAVPVVSAPAASTVSPEDAKWEEVIKAAQKEGEVTIYSFNFVGDVGTKLASAFDKRYGIKLNIITGRGAEFIERLKTEKRIGQMVADVSEGAAPHMLNMKEAAVTRALPDLPVLREKDVWDVNPNAIDKEAHVLATFQSVYSPWINTRVLKGDQIPKSMRDLLKPEWKGKIISHEPNTSSAAYNYFVPMVNAGVIDWKFVQDLGKQEMRLELGGVQALDTLVRGQLPLIIMNTDTNGARFVNEGAPVKAIAWQEGIVAHVGGMVGIEGAPHPNAAKVLANWLLMEEGQRIRGQAQGIFMVRKGLDFRPADARAPATKVVVSQAKDYDDQARLMRERYITSLWKN